MQIIHYCLFFLADLVAIEIHHMSSFQDQKTSLLNINSWLCNCSLDGSLWCQRLAKCLSCCCLWDKQKTKLGVKNQMQKGAFCLKKSYMPFLYFLYFQTFKEMLRYYIIASGNHFHLSSPSYSPGTFDLLAKWTVILYQHEHLTGKGNLSILCFCRAHVSTWLHCLYDPQPAACVYIHTMRWKKI